MNERTVAVFLFLVAALSIGNTAYAFDPDTDPSLVGWWRLDDASGNVAVDSSVNGNDGELIGNPQWVAGYFGGALALNGVDQYVDTGYTENIPRWTITAWVMSPEAPNSTDQPSGPLHREGNYQFNWSHSNGGTWPGSVGAYIGGWQHTTLGPLEGNTWYFLTGTYDGTAMSAYTNGQLASSLPLSGNPGNENNSLKFGRHAANAQYFEGTVDDARVYTVYTG